MVFQPSPQQAAFTEALLHGSSNLALQALAGTGKTATSVYASVRYAEANPEAKILICCFGAAAAKEVGEKLAAVGHGQWTEVDGRRRPPQIEAKTTHAIGLGVIKPVFNPGRPDTMKVTNLVRARNDTLSRESWAQIVELVEKAKTEAFGFFPDTQIGDLGAWYRLADRYQINGFEDTSDLDAVIEAAQAVYRASLAQTDVVDFGDMILWPLVKNLRAPGYALYDLVIVDECQDTSRARQALIRKVLKRDGRIVVVGDENQAIMAFAGADCDAMPNLISEFECEVLPLTVTRRCPKAVVREAQVYVPEYEAHEDNAEGEVLRLLTLPTDLVVGDAILCRHTAPLVTQAYKLIRAGIPAKVEGRDIGAGLASLARRWKVTTITALLGKLEIYQERETQKIKAKGNDPQKIVALEDRIETLREICKACVLAGKSQLQDVLAFIADLFGDTADKDGRPMQAVILATYHRSKGREWDRVFLLEHATRSPSPFAKRPDDVRQERNLAYVAITRAKRVLAYVAKA